MKLFFVFNPKAGKEKIKSKLGDIIELFSSKGHEITVHATTHKGDAKELIAKLPDDFDRVICAGGDGTLDEAVQGLSERKNKIPLGYIPAGSTNDFANSLGLPTGKVLEAAKVAISDRLAKVDVGNFNGQPFVYVAAFGAFTEVSYETSQESKNILGHAAYLVEAMKRLSEIQSFKMHVEAGNMVIDDEFIYGMVTNSQSVGGFKNITGENISLNDGLFEVTLIRKIENAANLNDVLAGLVDRNLGNKSMYYFKTDKLKIVSEKEIPWTLDGEFGGKTDNVEIKNLKKFLSIAIRQKEN